MLTSQQTYLGIQTSIYRDGGLYISGDPQVDGVITARNASAVQWQVAGVDVSGQTGLTYTVLSGDVGKAITARSTSGTIETSNALTALAKVAAPTVTQPPLVVGTPTVNVPLVINAATFTGSPDKIERTIYGSAQPTAQILARGPAASTGYTPGSTDATRSFVVVEEASNAAGSVRAVSPRSAWQAGPPGPTPPSPSSTLPAVPAGQMLAAFTTASRAFPNGMADVTDDPYPGKTSSVTASLNPGNTVNMRPLDINPTPIDVRGGMVSIAFYIRPSGTFARAVANLGNCYVNLYNNTNPTTAQTNYMRVVFGSLTFRSERIVPGWNIIRFPVEMFGIVGTIADTSAYLSSVRYAGVEFNHNSTNTDPFQVSVDFSNSFANPVTKGMVVLGFDDCRRDTYAYAYPKMKAYGFPGVLYPGNIQASLDQNNTFFMNTANLLEMQADGWQIGYQAYDTESPVSTLPEFSMTMDQLIQFYKDHGFTGPLDGSYFSNISYGSMYQSAFESHFRTMRDYMQFNDAASPRPEQLPPHDVRKLRSYGVNTAANSATNGLIPYAKKASQWKGVAIYAWHALGSGDAKIAADGGTLTSFEAFLEYLNSPTGRSEVDVVTYEEAVRRWRLATP